MWLHNALYTEEGSMSGFLSRLSRRTMSKTCFHTNCPPASPLGLPASLAFVRAYPKLWTCLKDGFSLPLRETDALDVFLASNCGWCSLCGGGDRQWLLIQCCRKPEQAVPNNHHEAQHSTSGFPACCKPEALLQKDHM